jgi:hypothetical protein
VKIQSGRVLARLGALLLVIAATLVGVDYAFHSRFVGRLHRDDLPPFPAPEGARVPLDVWKRIGFLRNHKVSSFLHRPIVKPEGIRRICAFGDSFTHGSEVDDIQDYPSILQKRFDEKEPGRVEVLNFGVASYGFHQSYLLWDGHGRDYGCDDVLLGPATFFAARDTSLQGDVGLANPYYLHARFALAGEDDLELIEVRGDTLEERFRDYFAFLPRWDYLRYDRAAPAFLQAWLPPGRTIDNPFYYRPTPSLQEEARLTYERLLRRLLADGGRVLLAREKGTPPIAPGLADEGLQRIDTTEPRWFPYRAPRGHFGPLGNDLIAGRFLEGLTGPGPIPLLVPAERPIAAPAPKESGPPLSSYAAVWIELAGMPIGGFTRGAIETMRAVSPTAFRKERIGALLKVGEPTFQELGVDAWTVDGCWVGLSRPLVAGDPVVLRMGDGERVIGHVALLAEGVNAGLVEPTGPAILDLGGTVEGNGLVMRGISVPKAAEGKPATVVLGSAPLLSGRAAKGKVFLQRPRGGCWRPRANMGGFVDVRTLPPSGDFELTLRGRGEERRVPIARWQRQPPPPGEERT